jgi:hypothetical protein
MLRRFHEDLTRIGLRERRQHDARRTFISIARADGARPDILRWATHGPTSDITDLYTTLPWDALCAEVAKAKINLLEGKVIAMPLAAAAGSEQVVSDPHEGLGAVLVQSRNPKPRLGKKGGADGTRTTGLRRDSSIESSSGVDRCRTN